MKKLLTLLLAVLLLAGCAGNKSGTFEAGKNTFLLNGKPFVVKAAEVHYPRIPREYWEHRIEMCKALGMNTLCLYVFWNLHEETPGKYDFTGNKDIAAFCNIKADVSSHDGRATVATTILEKTGNLRVAQEFLGHASVTTTELSTQVMQNQLREAAKL